MLGTSYLTANARRSRIAPLCASAVLHLGLLAWLLHKPAPRFVSPSSIAAGAGGSSLVYLFHPDPAGAAQVNARSPQRVIWRREKPRKSRSRRSKQPPESRVETDEVANENSATAAPPVGSRFGSVPGSVYTGHEVRPALRVSGSEPAIGQDDLRGAEGNVIVELTIDEHGAIISKAVIQSLAPSVDNKVLAALEDWHFIPATEDGVPIPSKEDVYYHFPVRR
jgi:TonB family protein